jgi:hypothetical protein
MRRSFTAARPSGRFAFVSTSLALSALCALAASSTAHAQDRCAALKSVAITSFDVHVTSADTVAAGPLNAPTGPGGPPAYTGSLPARCRVEGTIDPRKGVGGVDYAIRFALALPEGWNGRFLFQGGGGLNGVVQPPLGAVAAGDRPALARGFAVVSTDTGHQGAVFDGGFFADQQATLDFLWVANGKVAVVAKALVAAYYGRAAEHSYFVGCSTGGREGMIMSQRYPAYFDGIVAGAPAMRTGYSNLGLRSVSVALSKAAAPDANGNRVPGSALSAGDKKLLVDSLLKTCDAGDGVADGMLFNPQGCHFDPAALVCKGAKNDGCLTSAQAGAVRTAMSGPKASNGRPIYTGYFYDTGITFSGAGIPGVLNGAAPPVGPRAPATTQDVDAEAAEVAIAPSTLGDSNLWTNLSSFSGHGGKLLFFHGVSDPWFSALDTVGYYRALGEANGGADRVRDWSRHGPLRRWDRDARSLRSPERGRRLGREQQGTCFRRRDRRVAARAESAALRVSAARAVQGHGEHGRRYELRVPLAAIGRTGRYHQSAYSS